MLRTSIVRLSDVQDVWKQIQSVDPEVILLDHFKSISKPINSISVDKLPIYLYSPTIYACIFILKHQIHILKIRLLRTICLIDGGPKKERKRQKQCQALESSAKKKTTLKTSMARALELAASQGTFSGTQGNVPDRAGVGLDGLDPEAVLRSRTSSSTRSLLETQLGSQMRTGDSVSAQFLTIAHTNSQHITLEPDPNLLPGDEHLSVINLHNISHPIMADENSDLVTFSIDKNIPCTIPPVCKKRAFRPRSFTHLYDKRGKQSLDSINTTSAWKHEYTLLDDDVYKCFPLFTSQPPWMTVDRWWAKQIAVLIFTYEGSSFAFFGALASKSKTHTLTASHDLDQRGTSSTALPIHQDLNGETTSTSTFSDRMGGHNMDYFEGDAFNISYHGESGSLEHSSYMPASSKSILQCLEEKHPQPVLLSSMIKSNHNAQQRRLEASILFVAVLNLRANGVINIKQDRQNILCSFSNVRSNL